MRRLLAYGSLAVGGALWLSACGSSKSDDGNPNGNSGTGASRSGSGGFGVSLGGGSNSGAGNVDDACVDSVQMGRLVPLDIYIMLDVSGSMLDRTGAELTAPTKWQAVRTALESFIGDPASAGLGVGIQYFPLTDPTAPESCTSDAACGSHGPCFLRFCQNAGPGIIPCANDSECVTLDGTNVGPCTPLTYCWPPPQAAGDPLIFCHDATECGGLTASCVPFNECSADPDFACPVAGQTCGTDMGRPLGTCQPFNPDSFCLHTSLCDRPSYASPAAPIAALPGSAQALLSSIRAQDPQGNTPTAPALGGAIDHARTWATDHPDHKVVALLATDGLPTECVADSTGDPSGIVEVANAAAAGLSGDPSISTFVIGVFGPTDTEARQNLNQIADAGGTTRAFLVDTSRDVTAQFLSALNDIRSAQLSCEFLLPDPPPGQALDFDRVNVDFTVGGTKERIPRVASASSCGMEGGWYYDSNPASREPTKILICPSTCQRFEATDNGTVQIVLGCQTDVR